MEITTIAPPCRHQRAEYGGSASGDGIKLEALVMKNGSTAVSPRKLGSAEDC